MFGRLSNTMQSSKLRGTRWLVAALPMLVGPVIFNGNGSFIAIGMMFLIFGVVTLRRK